MISDVTQTYVRQTGLDAGLVDYKICAIDETWSGLVELRGDVTVPEGVTLTVLAGAEIVAPTRRDATRYGPGSSASTRRSIPPPAS